MLRLDQKISASMTTESKSRVLHENLDTTFVNLWSLLRSLSQRGFVGRVHVELKDYTADVFMTGSSTPLVHEIDRAAGTDTLEETALHRLVLRARESPGSISIFEGAEEAAAAQGGAAQKAVSSNESPGAPPIEAASRAMEEPASKRPYVSTTSSGEPISSADISTAPVMPDVEPEKSIGWSEVVQASGEVIGAVERALTGAGADFDSLFRATRLALADDYTFLDPMSAGFDYSNSVAKLSAQWPSNSYVIGISEALRRVVDKVATGDRARRVRERVALDLALLARKRNEALTRTGFRAQLDRIAGTKVL